MHLAFAGVGGHRAVVEGIATAHASWGINSAAVLVAPTAILHQTPAWRGLSQEARVPLSRRGDFRSMFQVANEVRRLRPKVVIAHTLRHVPAAWLGLLLAGRRPRMVLVEHQPLPLRAVTDELWSGVGTLLTRTTVLLSNTYAQAYRWTSLSRVLRRRIEVIANGVMIPSTSPTEPSAIARSTVTIGMASRLIPSKDVGSLIRAVALLSDDADVSYRLSIAGEGTQRRALEALADELGVSDRVAFEGALSASAMEQWYQSIDCYVQSSLGEAMSMSLLEAAARKMPIITSDVEGIRDVFTHGHNAIILASTTPSSIAAAVRTLQEPGYAHQLSGAAFRRIAEHHSSESMAARYRDLLIQTGALSSKQT